MASVARPLGLNLFGKNESNQPSKRDAKVEKIEPEVTHSTAGYSEGKEQETEIDLKEVYNNPGPSRDKGKGDERGQHSKSSLKKYANKPLQATESTSDQDIENESEAEVGEWKGIGGTTEEFASESEQQTEGYVQPDLYEGQLASAEQRKNRQPNIRPERIEKHWKSMYMLVKGWWKVSGKQLDAFHQNKVDEIQAKIRAECNKMLIKSIKEDPNKYKSTYEAILLSIREEEKRQGGKSQMSEEAINDLAQQKVISHYTEKDYLPKYRFPAIEIFGHMEAIIASMNTIEAMAGNVEQEQQRTSLLRGFAVLQEKLKDWNIPLQSILSPTAWKMIDSVVNYDEKTRKEWQTIVNELIRPTKDQETIWELAAPGIRDIVTTINTTQDMIDDDDIQKVEDALVSLKQNDKEMQVSNKKHEMPETINALPLSLLYQMASSWKNQNRTETEASKDSLKKLLAMQPLATNLLESLDTDSSNTKELPESRNPESHVSLQQIGVSKGSPSNSTTHNENRPKPMSQPAATGLGIEELDITTMKGLQALGETLSGEDVIEMFEYKNGITEYGPVVAIRPSRTDNLKFTRFIVNAGTADRPHHKIIKGTELCPGGAETLAQMKDMEINFNLRDRKGRMKSTPNFIKKTGPCAVMSRSEGYAPRPGSKSKPRRPDTYIRVLYNDNQEEWLTRTEYVQLVGPSFAERRLKELVAKYETRSKYMDACKQAKVHPGTILPLTQKDREEAPWLFVDDQQAGGFYAGSNKGTDIDNKGSFQEPELDDGDGPAAKTDSLGKQKSRAAIPTTVDLDEEL